MLPWTITAPTESYSSRAEFPNDVVGDADGNMYVIVCSGKGCLSLSGKMCAPMTPLMLVRPNGKVPRAAEGLCFPVNGMVITPDGKTLIVAETFYESGIGATPPMLTAFDRDMSTGSLSDRRVWASLPILYPDAITLDREGCVWVAACLSSRVPLGSDQLSDPDDSCFPKNPCKWSGFVRVAQGGECKSVVHLPADERQALSCTLGGTELSQSGSWRPCAKTQYGTSKRMGALSLIPFPRQEMQSFAPSRFLLATRRLTAILDTVQDAGRSGSCDERLGFVHK